MTETDKQSISTTWGKNQREIDVRALRTYNRILCFVAKASETFVFVLIASIGIAMILFFNEVNFENAIFNDGTDNACVIDGKTGNITNVK